MDAILALSGVGCFLGGRGSGAAIIRGLYPVTQAHASSNSDLILGTRYTQSTNGAAWAIYVNNGSTDFTVFLNGSTTADTGNFNGLVYSARFTYEAA